MRSAADRLSFFRIQKSVCSPIRKAINSMNFLCFLSSILACLTWFANFAVNMLKQITQHSTKSKFLIFSYRFCMEAVVCCEPHESNSIEITVKFEIAHQSQLLPSWHLSICIRFKIQHTMNLYMCNLFFSQYIQQTSVLLLALAWLLLPLTQPIVVFVYLKFMKLTANSYII